MSQPVALLAAIVVCLLLVAAVLGLVSLRRWLRFRTTPVPTARIATHIALQLTSIGLWIAFIATSSTWLAWSAFVVITVGQVFGDLLMFASYRARHRVTGSVRYRSVARDVLGFARPVPALHALVGALAYFTMLVTCIVASIG